VLELEKGGPRLFSGLELLPHCSLWVFDTSLKSFNLNNTHQKTKRQVLIRYSEKQNNWHDRSDTCLRVVLNFWSELLRSVGRFLSVIASTAIAVSFISTSAVFLLQDIRTAVLAIYTSPHVCCWRSVVFLKWNARLLVVQLSKWETNKDDLKSESHVLYFIHSCKMMLPDIAFMLFFIRLYCYVGLKWNVLYFIVMWGCLAFYARCHSSGANTAVLETWYYLWRLFILQLQALHRDYMFVREC